VTLSDSHRILDAIRRLVRLLRLYDRAAQSRLGLSAAQLFVLSELGKTPALSLGALAERTHTDQSSVSVVVTRLVEAGLVERQRAEDDARRLALTLTRAGRAALQKAPPVAQEQLLEIIGRLTPAERKRFADTFAQIVDELGGGPAPMLFEENGQTKDNNRNERTRPRARRNQ
jgi:DNA-binding MarR family transcriptional regulator